MGLDTSHDAWHGPYSAFGRWRGEIAKLIGIDLKAMEGFGGEGKWGALPPDALHVLLNHSDCDGDIAPEDCAKIADRLEELLPSVPADPMDYTRKKTEAFIKGCRAAAAAGERLDFH